jgi:hypothetical protein
MKAFATIRRELRGLTSRVIVKDSGNHQYSAVDRYI